MSRAPIIIIGKKLFRSLLFLAFSLLLGWVLLNFAALKDRYNYRLGEGANTVRVLDPDRLEIPKLGISGKIIFPGDLEELESSLDQGVNHYPGSSIIGEKGNAILTAHSSSVKPGPYQSIFSTIDYLEKGDEVLVYVDSEEHRYVVESSLVISSDDVDYINSKDDNHYLSLITCWPIGTQINRLVVTAIASR